MNRITEIIRKEWSKEVMLGTLLNMILLLSLTACGYRQVVSPEGGDTLTFKYAERISVVKYDGYAVATLQNPWDTLRTLHTYVLVPDDEPLPTHLPEGTLIRTPLKRSVVYTSVHCSLIEVLGAGSSIGGVCDLKYIKVPLVQQGCSDGSMLDCGDGMNPDIEKIIDLHPDALLLSPFNNSGGYGRVEELDIPLVECADYMETSALGRAEWMKFYGMLYGKEEAAQQLFEEVECNYLHLKEVAAQAASHPTVIPDLKMGSTWYMPGGRSTQGRLFADAGAVYPFADTDNSGSIPMSVEVVMEKATEADIWIVKLNSEVPVTLPLLVSDYEGYRELKAYKTGQVFACNTSSTMYYEEAPYRPDYLLQDMIQMFHPDVQGLGEMRYFQRVE